MSLTLISIIFLTILTSPLLLLNCRSPQDIIEPEHSPLVVPANKTGSIYGRIMFSPEAKTNTIHHFTLLHVNQNKVIAYTKDSVANERFSPALGDGIFTFDNIPAGTYALAIRREQEGGGFVHYPDTLSPIVVQENQVTLVPVTQYWREKTDLNNWTHATIPEEGFFDCRGTVLGQVNPEVWASASMDEYALSLTSDNKQSERVVVNVRAKEEILLELDEQGRFHSDSVPCGIYTAVVYSNNKGDDFQQSERYFDVLVLPGDTVQLHISSFSSNEVLYRLMDELNNDINIPAHIYTSN